MSIADEQTAVEQQIQALQGELGDVMRRYGTASLERDRAVETAQRHMLNAGVLQQRLDIANERLADAGLEPVPGLGEPLPEAAPQEPEAEAAPNRAARRSGSNGGTRKR